MVALSGGHGWYDLKACAVIVTVCKLTGVIRRLVQLRKMVCSKYISVFWMLNFTISCWNCNGILSNKLHSIFSSIIDRIYVYTIIGSKYEYKSKINKVNNVT